jgi:general secretion pathway protein G
MNGNIPQKNKEGLKNTVGAATVMERAERKQDAQGHAARFITGAALRGGAAFTLVELMIVVAILGILAAIVIPEFQGHIQQAKEAAAKDNLRILRQAIERYEAENGVPPGYPSNDPSSNPGVSAFNNQLFRGDYLPMRPENPFSNLSAIKLIGNDVTFPEAPESATLYGWLYQPATKTIKLNWPGTDSKGTLFFDY